MYYMWSYGCPQLKLLFIYVTVHENVKRSTSDFNHMAAKTSLDVIGCLSRNSPKDHADWVIEQCSV